jgi:hypothetical protein
MRSTAAIMLMTGLTLVALAACSKSDEKKTTTTTGATTTLAPLGNTAEPAATVAAARAGSVEASAEMKGFMAMLDGKDDSAGKALKKYGSKAVQGDDLGMYTLKDPKVTHAEKVGDQQCYTMESTAGMMEHTTVTCWDAKGKISKITDTSK